VRRRDHEADEAHVVVERQPRDAAILGRRAQPVEHDRVAVHAQVLVRDHHALGPRGRARGELEEREILAATGSGPAVKLRLRISSSTTRAGAAAADEVRLIIGLSASLVTSTFALEASTWRTVYRSPRAAIVWGG
jgi:hypothetical protein